MEHYRITGMSCAACQARIEKAVSKVYGVNSCSVSLLTNSMSVEGTAKSSEIIKAVVDAGYGASLKEEKGSNAFANYDDALNDTETPKIKKRLIASFTFLIPLMYVSMGHMMWNWPLPPSFAENHIAVGIFELLLTALIMVINQNFFISGFKGLIHGAPNMDTLVALGASSSFIYSVYALFSMSEAVLSGNHNAAMSYMDEFYFESAAMILTLITVGKMLEAHSKGKTTNALKGLMNLAPKKAVVIKNGTPTEVPVESVGIDDRFIVKSGESVPVDGIIIEGNGAVDESALTGESIPIDKEVGDSVSAATINKSGYLVCKATRVGEDTTLSQIIQMVNDASATKAPIAKIADKVSGVFVPIVMGIAAITFIVWMITGSSFGFSLSRAISVLVISCPCALGLATPVAIMVGNGISAKNGIMFKTAASLEEAGKTQIVALDKTGTITKGEPTVREIIPAGNVSEKELLETAYSLEIKSEHPLARAVINTAEKNKVKMQEASNFETKAGNGISATVNGEKCVAGNLNFVEKYVSVSKDFLTKANDLSETGMTPLFFSKGDSFLGIIAVADIIKEDSAKAVNELKKMGIHICMLTGDNEKTANAVGKEAGVDEVIAGVLPSGKEDVIKALQQYGKVTMVGDGINDAPALTRADIGIAIGTGTDIAIDAADIVLMKNSLSDVAAAIRISRATLRNIRENLFWAFFYNCIGIPLAAGLWIPIFGWSLSPMFAAAAMSLSSFCVVSNALRLNLFKMYNNKHDKKVKNALCDKNIFKNIKAKKEKTKMEITVNGMMCAHCEAHTKEALMKLDGITSVTADHSTNTVSIEMSKNISEAEIKAAVESAGYEYGGLK